MPAAMLYSVNPYYAVDVSRRYRKQMYFAWCSEYFSSNQQAGDAPSSGIAASSDPMTIYEQLDRAVHSEDRHDSRIKGYKKTFARLADIWLSKKEITVQERDEIRAACRQPSWRMWRPLLFTIPRAPIDTSGRLSLVPVSRRAGPGNEYTVSGLLPHEFDIIELPRLR